MNKKSHLLFVFAIIFAVSAFVASVDAKLTIPVGNYGCGCIVTDPSTCHQADTDCGTEVDCEVEGQVCTDIVWRRFNDGLHNCADVTENYTIAMPCTNQHNDWCYVDKKCKCATTWKWWLIFPHPVKRCCDEASDNATSPHNISVKDCGSY